jgi:hypothetical protein
LILTREVQEAEAFAVTLECVVACPLLVEVLTTVFERVVLVDAEAEPLVLVEVVAEPEPLVLLDPEPVPARTKLNSASTISRSAMTRWYAQAALAANRWSAGQTSAPGEGRRA